MQEISILRIMEQLTTFNKKNARFSKLKFFLLD